MCLLAEGHLLIEDVPGVGKTSLAKALAASIDCTLEARPVHPRPAARPTSSASASTSAPPRRFVFQPGPLFANIVLADEINRASPKTQSALLEAMEERQITVDGRSRQLAAAVHGDRHAEPRRAGGHLPTAREPARPLPAAHLARLSGPRRRDADPRRARAQPTRCRRCSRWCRSRRSGDDRGGARACTSRPRSRRTWSTSPRPSRRHPGIELGLSPRATLQLAARRPRPRRRPRPQLRHARRRQGGRPSPRSAIGSWCVRARVSAVSRGCHQRGLRCRRRAGPSLIG